jgi:cyclopropane-fatty-acyl-phospholipid synthase
MNAQAPVRGDHRASPNGSRMARIMATRCHRMLDRIDAGIIAGSIETSLPDGSVRILGGRGAGPMVTLDIRKWRALARLALAGSVGWYEGWAAGEWHSPDIVGLCEIFMRNRVTLGSAARARGLSRLARRVRHALRNNHRHGARRNILAHYDLGNEFYAAWLDPGLTYSSALFAPGDTLAVAQARKIAAMLDRTGLNAGQTMLEIGCGWGSLLAAARARGIIATGITLSPSQRSIAQAHGTVHLRDYRDETGTYDGIVSVEMIEAVGQRYWPVFIDRMMRSLKPGGRAVIQYISIADDVFESYAGGADFIQSYIFPGGMLISHSRFRALAEARGFIWADQRDFGADYAETLRCWRHNFDDAIAAGRLPPGFDARFIALWRFYLMYCEGGFRAGGIDVSHVTLIRPSPDDQP